MKSKFNNSHAYMAFNRTIKKVESFYESRFLSSFLGYSNKDIFSRLIQRIVSVSFPSSVNYYLQNHKLINSNLNQFYNFSQLSIHGLSGQVKLNIIFISKLLIEFLYFWFWILFKVTLYLFIKSKPLNSACLFYGLGHEYTNKKKLNDFCAFGPLLPLSKAEKIFVQASFGGKFGKLVFGEAPILILLKYSNISFKDYFFFLSLHFQSFYFFFLNAIKFPLSIILARDIAYHAAATILNERNLISDIVLTLSNFMEQPLWMTSLKNKNFNLHMVYYSQNNRPMLTQSNDLDEDYPANRHIKVDIRWVWTNWYKLYLKSRGVNSEIRVVGPILFYLPPKNLRRNLSRTSFDIVVFDITPVNDKTRISNGLGDYWSSHNMTKFIIDIIQSKDEIELKYNIKLAIKLKTKRAYHKNNDLDYIQLINNFEKSGKLNVVDFSENLYSFLCSASIAISTPFTSTALVADLMNVPSIYYDPTGDLLPFYDKSPNISFINEQQCLTMKIFEILYTNQKDKFLSKADIT